MLLPKSAKVEFHAIIEDLIISNHQCFFDIHPPLFVYLIMKSGLWVYQKKYEESRWLRSQPGKVSQLSEPI